MFGRIGIPEPSFTRYCLIVLAHANFRDGRSLGGIKEFRQATQEVSNDRTRSINFDDEGKKRRKVIKTEAVQEENSSLKIK